MRDFYFTKHAETRMRQRGFRNADVDLVLRVSTQIGNDAYLLTNEDASREIEFRRCEIQQIERLRGSKFIVENGALITLYHTETKSSRSGSGQRGRQT